MRTPRHASNDLLAEIHYPDTQRITIGSITKPQPVQLDYNRQGEVVAMRDPNTTLHEYSRDLLGRVTLDKATVSTSIAAFEIDFRVNALATTYDAMGRVERVRSYTDHGGGSEAVVNEVAFNRDPLWRVVSVAQQHDGAVTGGSLAVGTSYETEPIASGNLARQATLVYPGGWTLATGYGSSGSLDDRISRPAALVDPAISSPDPQAYAAYSYIGLATPALVDLPIPGFRLTRFHADNGETTPGAYPGLDRYGRVVRQMWVDDGFTENSGSSTVPNVPPIVSTAYTYDTASNRTGAFDARPKSSQPLSNMYAYDGLHRLVNARRGVWTGGLASPSVSQLKGSQEWALDPLGNWSSGGTDLDGAGGIDADETEPRDHRDPSLTPPTNRVNELFQRELSVDSGGGTVDLAYDYAGNLLRQQLQSGGALRYTHDAWNRLVKVEFEDAEEELHPRAEYEYNPLNWRTVTRADTNTTDATHELDEMRVMLYDASWRLLESRIDSDYDPESEAPDFEEFTQHVWGLRYIDDIVATRRDLDPAEDNGHEVKMFHATDAQFSSVAVLLDNGSLLERVAYSPYGVARHQWPADASGDGAVNSADLSIVLSSYGSITGSTYRSEADFNRDGDVDAADLAAVLSYAAALPEGTLSSPGIANRTGYCGYRFAPETEMYLARNRWNSPPLGRWIERDPLGYVDGMGLYEYVRGRAASASDPWGLQTARGLVINSDLIEVALGDGLAAEITSKLTVESRPCCGMGPFVNANEDTVCLELNIWAGIGIGGKVGLLAARIGLFYKVFGAEAQHKFCVTVDCNNRSCNFTTQRSLSIAVNNELAADFLAFKASIGTRAAIGIAVKFTLDVCAGTGSIALGYVGEVDIAGGIGLEIPRLGQPSVEGSLLPDGSSVPPTFRPLTDWEFSY